MDASVFKTIKFTERTSFTMHMTALNALNHFNFTNVDVAMEDAGVGRFGADFANPSVTSAAGRIIWVGGTFRF
jgi:hypothetical protein